MEWSLVGLGVLGAVIGAGATILSGLNNRITYLQAGRNGVTVYTNSDTVNLEISGTLKDIDAETSEFIRKGTTAGKMLLDPVKYGITAETMLVNYKAMLLLVYAAYENHHTRNLVENGTDLYITEKTNDIVESIQIWQDKFPVLQYEFVEGYVCHWIKKILIPNVMPACNKKIIFYKKLLARTNVSETLKTEIKAWLAKNEDYVAALKELLKCSLIQKKSSIFYKEP